MTHRKPFSATRLLKRYAIWWIVLLFIVALFSGYALGYRVGPGLSIVKAGVLSIPNLPPSTSIYVDTKLRAVVRDGGEYRTRLIPGTHTIIVDALDRTPWHDAVSITSGADTVANPVLLPKEADGQVLKGEVRAAAIASIDAKMLPTAAAPLTAGCTNVYVSENRFIGSLVPGCTPAPAYLCEAGECGATVLLTPVDTITSVVLYPGRTDTLLFTIGDWAYVLDIDPRDPRFFAPFLRTVSPKFGIGADGTLILKDEDNAYTFAL